MAYEDLIAKYFPQEAWGEAHQIMMLESGGNPYARNYSAIEDSRGPFQINVNAHGEGNWYDPETNIAYAAKLYRAAGNTFARDWVNAYNIIHGGGGGRVSAGTFSGSSIADQSGPPSATATGGGGQGLGGFTRGAGDAIAAYTQGARRPPMQITPTPPGMQTAAYQPQLPGQAMNFGGPESAPGPYSDVVRRFAF